MLSLGRAVISRFQTEEPFQKSRAGGLPTPEPRLDVARPRTPHWVASMGRGGFPGEQRGSPSVPTDRWLDAHAARDEADETTTGLRVGKGGGGQRPLRTYFWGVCT